MAMSLQIRLALEREQRAADCIGTSAVMKGSIRLRRFGSRMAGPRINPAGDDSQRFHLLSLAMLLTIPTLANCMLWPRKASARPSPGMTGSRKPLREELLATSFSQGLSPD